MYVGLVKIRLIAKQLKMPHGHPSVSQILLHCANYLSIKLIGPSVWTWGVCVNEIWKWNSTETEFRVENHMRRCWKTTRRSENDNTLSPWISQWIAHSWTNRSETVGVSHWPITWPMYLPCIVTQEQAHCVSSIVSNSHLFHSKSIEASYS